MTVDIASIGIQVDTRPIAEGMKALDALGDASVRVDAKVDSANKTLDAMSAASANVWRRGGEAAKGVDALGDASAKTAQRMSVNNGQMSDTAKLMQMQADQAKAAALANTGFGDSTARLTLGQLALTEKFREQAATLGMSRSQLMAYQAAQMGLTTEVSKSIAVFKAQEDAIKAAAAAKAEAEKSANRLAEAIQLLAAGYALLKVGEYIKDAALMAARYETLGVVLEVVGRNAGYTKIQMEHAAEGIAKQGITMVESREAAIKLVQAHIDLKHAAGLARIAQDAAVIGHMNSSEAMDRLVNGISRGNVLILRNIGINVNLQTAYRQMADSLGKTTKELSENERVEARRIAVFERGIDINSVYSSAMDTAGKQIMSMSRYTQDFKTMFGEVFNESLTIGVMGLTDHLKGSNKAITDLSKNDQLEEWGHNLTMVFVGIVTAVSNAVTAMQKVDAFARHMDKRKDIGLDADSQIADNFSNSKLTSLSGVTNFYQNNKRIDSVRQAALAEENARYEAEQGALTANYGKFERAADERGKTRTAKRNAEADLRLKADQKYAADVADIQSQVAGKGEAAMADAAKKVKALYQSVYEGTPDYRDTEGREPKPKVNAAENTRLADQLKRYETEAAAAKAEADYLIKIDDMRHKAGELGDAEYYANRKTYANMITGADVAAYDKQLAELRKHHNNTEGEGAKNAKAIHDIEDKKAAAQQKFGFEDLTRDEEERLRQKAIVTASDDAANKYIEGLNAQMAAIDAANGKRAQSASSIAAETAAQTRAAAAAMAIQAAGPAEGGHTQADVDAAKAMLVALNLQADAQERIAALIRDGEAAAASRKLADQAIQDWKNVGQTVGESLSNAFGAAGKAAGGMFKAYAENAARQLELDKKMAAAKIKLDSDPEKLRLIAEIKEQSAASEMKSYGDMADAAQSYFEQGSEGYKLVGVASKALHAAEMAMNLASIGPKMAAAAAEFFAQSGWGGFAGVAAMTAVVAGFGVAMSGGSGGGGQTAAEVQKTQGTGSVFGDSSAKSDSIARSIALSAANSNIELNYTAGMLSALKSIDASMSGLANLVVGTTGVTDGSNLGIKEGTLSKSGIGTSLIAGQVGSMIGSIFGPIGTWVGGAIGSLVGKLWGKTTQNIVDSGLQLGGSVSDLQSGKGFQQYASVDTTKSSWFGLSKKTSNSVQTAGLDSDLSSQFGLIFTNLEKALTVAAGGLGIGADQVGSALDQLVISTTKISLKDLKGDELTSAINGVISKTMDEMAAAAIPGLDKFRKVGEGYAETVVRIATDYANVDAILMSIGKTFGWAGTSSIAARENLIELAGGIDELASMTSGFASNFLSQAEQLAPVQKYVTDQLAAMGLGYVKTRDDFKSVVLGLNLTDPAAQQTYASLMQLQEAFAKTHAATVDLSKSEQEIADERKDLQSQLDELTMTSAQLLAKQRDALDASNRGLFDQIQAATAAKKAQDDAKASLTTYLGTMTTFANSVKGFNSALVMGSLSTLTPEQQYAEARRQFETTRDKAATGDATAQGALQGIENTFLTLSQKLNGGDSQYSSDLANVMKANDLLAEWSAGQVDVAQASLNALNEQVDGITQLNATMLTVAQNMQYLPTLTGDVSTPVFATPTPAIDYSTYGTASVAPLVAAITALQAEVKALRADNDRQTGALMQNAEVVGAKTAETIVDGVEEAVTDGAYAASNDTRRPS